MGRASCWRRWGLKRGRWTAEEDEILIFASYTLPSTERGLGLGRRCPTMQVTRGKVRLQLAGVVN
jgi:hypothetical protein